MAPELPPVTVSIALTLVILCCALLALVFEWLASDVVALGVVVALLLTGLLDPRSAFAGFGSETVLTMGGLLVLTAALLRTGVVDAWGRAVLQRSGGRPGRVIALLLGSALGLSSFVSNTATTAVFLPTALGLSRRARISPSRLLMPLAYVSILASSVTLVATSTNIVVDGLLRQQGLAPMRLFELAPVGIPIALLGFAYVLFVMPKLLPERAKPSDLADDFGITDYLAEIVILPNSPLAGRSIAASGLNEELDVSVLRVRRGKTALLAPNPEMILEEGDELLVQGDREEILKAKEVKGLALKADVYLSDPALEGDQTRLAEVVVLHRSPLIGRSLQDQRFRERFGLQVLALHRAGTPLRSKLSDVPLRLGDVLLVQGHRDRIKALAVDVTLRIVGGVGERRSRRNRAPLAILAFGAALLAGATGLLPLSVAIIAGAFLVLLTRCLTPEEAYRDVEWRLLVVIGGMLALGAAMQQTGTAAWLAEQIVVIVGHAGPLALLAGFFLLTTALTQPMSNQAAAALVFPVALQAALRLGLDPRPFAMTVAIAASCSFMTPLEPSCLMVLGPGRYRFRDFVVAGAPLTLMVFLITMALVPLIWPL